jgi:hypothetical protein
MAGLHGLPESSGPTVSDHQTNSNQHQTVEKGNTNTSTLFRKATTVRGRDAAREGGGAIAGSRKLLKLMIQSTTVKKEKHGEGEKEMASSPKRRRRTQIHPQAPTMNNSYSLGFQTY